MREVYASFRGKKKKLTIFHSYSTVVSWFAGIQSALIDLVIPLQSVCVCKYGSVREEGLAKVERKHRRYLIALCCAVMDGPTHGKELVLRKEQKHEAEVHFHSSAPALSVSPSLHSISSTHSLSLHLCLKFQLKHEVTQSCRYNTVIYHISFSPSVELLKYAIASVIKGSACVWVWMCP